MGLPLSATLAIGDSYNDLPMLAAAGLGVVMGNAPPAIQAAAGVLTADNDHDGVALALRRYVSACPTTAGKTARCPAVYIKANTMQWRNTYGIPEQIGPTADLLAPDSGQSSARLSP